MNLKDLGAIIGIGGSIVGGVVWGWEKAVKPFLDFLKRLEDGEKNITELKSKVSTLNEQFEYSSKKTDSIIYLSDVAMFVCNSEGICILANQAVCDIFGATENQMRGYGWANFLHPDDRGKAIRMWEDAIENGGNDITAHYRIVHGETQEEIKATYHAVIARNEQNEVIVSVGRVTQK